VLTIIDQSGHVLAQGKTGPSNPWVCIYLFNSWLFNYIVTKEGWLWIFKGICENGQDAFKTVANKLNDLIVETLRSIQVECNHTHLERVVSRISVKNELNNKFETKFK
jgi:hypothetical protein